MSMIFDENGSEWKPGPVLNREEKECVKKAARPLGVTLETQREGL